MDKKQQYAVLETTFGVIIFVTAILGHLHHADPAHAHAAILFRLGGFLVGVGGLVTIYFLKRRVPDDGTMTLVTPVSLGTVTLAAIPASDAVEWSVNDRSTRADALRCNLYVMTHRSQTAIPLLGLPVLVSCLIALPLALTRPVLAAEIAAVVFGGWFLFLGAAIYFDLVKRYPRPDSDRLCTTTLTQMGFEDVTPNGSTFVPWSQVTEIREQSGDIYLWRVGGKGNFITRNAFQNALEAREFQRRATELWKNPVPLPAGMTTTPSAAYQSNVWPPPPQV